MPNLESYPSLLNFNKGLLRWLPDQRGNVTLDLKSLNLNGKQRQTELVLTLMKNKTVTTEIVRHAGHSGAKHLLSNKCGLGSYSET